MMHADAKDVSLRREGAQRLAGREKCGAGREGRFRSSVEEAAHQAAVVFVLGYDFVLEGTGLLHGFVPVAAD